MLSMLSRNIRTLLNETRAQHLVRDEPFRRELIPDSLWDLIDDAEFFAPMKFDGIDNVLNIEYTRHVYAQLRTNAAAVADLMKLCVSAPEFVYEYDAILTLDEIVRGSAIELGIDQTTARQLTTEEVERVISEVAEPLDADS